MALELTESSPLFRWIAGDSVGVAREEGARWWGRRRKGQLGTEERVWSNRSGGLDEQGTIVISDLYLEK